MSETDDILLRLIMKNGARSGALKAYKREEQAAEARASVARYRALRARLRADAGLVAAGIDPKDYERELKAAVSQ